MPAGDRDTSIRLTIGAYLLGARVRYNGGHPLDHCPVHTLDGYVEGAPVCPEPECRRSAPRRLCAPDDGSTGITHLERMLHHHVWSTSPLANRRIYADHPQPC